MLYAESMVLLSLTPGGRVIRGAGNRPYVAVGVAGALVSELIDRGHVELPDGRIRVTGSRPPEPLLIHLLWFLERSDGKKLRSKLASLSAVAWDGTIETMTASGQITLEKAFLRYTRFPVRDLDAQREQVSSVRSAAVGDGPLDRRAAVLLAMAGPCNLLEVVAPDTTDRTKAKQRIAAATALVPAAVPVKDTIQSIASSAAIVTYAG